jgi:DNA-binding beta-propeller fold protein YncE
MPAHVMPAEVPKNMANTYVRAESVTVDSADVSLLVAGSVGRGPVSDLAADAGVLVVTNFGDNTVAVVDAETLAVRGGVVTGHPSAAVTANGRAFVAVSSASDDAIAVIDTANGHLSAAYPMDGAVTAMAVSADGKRVYVGRDGRDGVDVAVIDIAAERLAAIDIVATPDSTIDALRLDDAGRRLFVAVTDSASSRVVVVDVATGRVRRTIEIGAPIRGLELGHDSTAFVLTSDITSRGVLHVVDLVGNRVAGAVCVGDAPTQLALSADGSRAFVVDYDRVHVVSTETYAVVGNVTVGARPACVAVAHDRLYVADQRGELTSYAITAPVMYAPPFVAALPVASERVRELQPAGV